LEKNRFIKARSTRHPINGQVGYSNPEDSFSRTGRNYTLNYKIQLSIRFQDYSSFILLVASANDNEKKHSLTTLDEQSLCQISFCFLINY